MHLTVRTVKVHDTGLGREAGYRDDAELAAAAEAERAKVDPAARELFDRVNARVERAVLFGEGR